MAGQARTGTVRGGGRANRAALLLALVLGAAAALLTFVFLSQRSESAQSTQVATKPVVVAKADIPARTQITSDVVEIKAIPVTGAHPQAFTKLSDVVGQVTQFPVAMGEQILPNKLALSSALASTTGTGTLPLSVVIPEGKRAMSIKVSQLIGAGGLIRPGDFVDVIMVAELEDIVPLGDGTTSTTSGQPVKPRTVAVPVLQNVEVLAIAQQVTEVTPQIRGQNQTGTAAGAAQATATPGAENLSEEERVRLSTGRPNPEASTVTLAVSPEQAGVLFLAEQKGTLRLLLRAFGDDASTPAFFVPDILLLPETVRPILIPDAIAVPTPVPTR